MENHLSFEEAAQANGSLWWDAYWLMELLDYKNYSSFKQVINKARSSCLGMEIETDEDFYRHTNTHQKSSYKLSRFACFIITLQADDKKKRVQEAKVYFAQFAAELFNQHDLLERLEKRKELTAGEKAMQNSAANKGLSNNKFGIFKDSGIRGMYNMSLEHLKKYKGLSSKTTTKQATLYDFMNLEEMAANTFRTTQTAAKIRNTKGKMPDKDLIATANKIGKEVRDMMSKNSGQYPENIPLEDLSTKRIGSSVKKSKKTLEHNEKIQSEDKSD